MLWTKTKTLELIREYRKNAILWNDRCRGHYDKSSRRDVWEGIGFDIHVDDELCKKKMKNVLATLRKERAKIKKRAKQGKGPYSSRWFAFRHLQFLFDKDTPVESGSSAMPEQAADVTEGNQERGNETTEETVVTRRNPPPDTNVPQAGPKPSCSYTRPSVKRKREEASPQADGMSNQYATPYRSSAPNDDDGESQDFGNVIAKKLRKYNEVTRSYIQSQIMTIFLNVDTGLCNSNQSQQQNLLFQPFQSVSGYQPFNNSASPTHSGVSSLMHRLSSDERLSLYTSSSSGRVTPNGNDVVAQQPP